MNIFTSEAELIAVLDEHDLNVLRCAQGEIGFWEFVETDRSFYGYYALDGHESDEAERALLIKHEHRIETHRIIAEEILGGVCTEEDMKNPLYPQAGRFGPDVALQKLQQVARERLNWNGQQGH